MSSFPDWMMIDHEVSSGGPAVASLNTWGDEDTPAQPSGQQEAEAVKAFKFYDDTITIYFDPVPHVYYRFEAGADGTLVRKDIDGVTTVLNVISKPFLVPWATKLTVETMKGLMFNADGSLKDFSTEELLAWMKEAKDKHKERLNEAGDIGSLAHNAIEDSINHALAMTNGVVQSTPVVNPPVWMNATPENIAKAQHCANHAFAWMQSHNVRWIHTERKIYSREYDYSGTADGRCLVDSCTDRFCKGCRGRSFKDRLTTADWKSSNHLSDSYAYQTAAYQYAEMEEHPDLVILDRWVLRLGKEDGDFEPWYLPPEYFEADFEAFLAALQLHRSLEEIRDRRSTANREYTEMIRAVKRAEREAAEAADKEERRQAREALSQAKKEWDANKKVHYKNLRSQGLPKVEAEAQTDAAYPKSSRPGAKDEETPEQTPVVETLTPTTSTTPTPKPAAPAPATATTRPRAVVAPGTWVWKG